MHSKSLRAALTDGENRLIWHIAGFFAILIPLVYLGPKNSADFVFTSSADAGAWSNPGLAFCVGLITSTFPFVGYDAASHVSLQEDSLSHHRRR